VCLAGALATADAHAAGVVVTVRGEPTRIREQTLRDAVDVPAGSSVLRSEPGPGEVIAHPPAVSMPRLLALAGVAAEGVSFVTVRRANGSEAVLRPGDLAAPSLVWLDGGSVRFFRPVRGDADLNAADNLATAGDDLAVRVRQGPLLDVAVRVRPARPRAGERVRLEAQVTGAAAASAITVRWSLGDGAERAGAATTHRWQAPGLFAVVASAEGDDDSAGSSEPLLVRVGAARPAGDKGAGGGRDDPDHAPATGPAEPSRAGGGTGGAETGGGGATTGGGAPPVARPPRDRAQDRTRSPRAVSRKQRLRAHPKGSEHVLHVEGVLVAARVPGSTATAGAAAAARAGSTSDRVDPTLPLAGAAACALLAAGALRERRRDRR
jgi:hypothetical protein